MVDPVPVLVLEDLVKLPVASEWKRLGLQLGVPNHRLLQIQRNNQHSPDFAQECLTDMFYWWLNNGHDVKHKRVACALIAIGKRELAQQFQEDGEITHQYLVDQTQSSDSCFDMFTQWYCNVPITSILLITISIALACTSPNVYPSNGLPVVLDGEVFLGRRAEVGMISEWIQNSTVNIISIVGSPGFGKSTLAIHVGHVITEMGGVAVHYTDLYEVPDITVLKKKLILLVCVEDRQSFDVQHLSMWASKLKVPTVLIFDNCDEVLHKFKDAFQILIKNLVRQSRFLKVLLTAKQMTSFLGSFRQLTLTELPTDSAADVLQMLSSTLNRTMALEIAGLVGSVPLALQVVGSLLTQVDPSTIANELRRNPIPALSPELLPSTERVFTSLNISYHYLIPQHQRCGRLLANFPGSFDDSAVQGILEGKLVNDTSECLKTLQHKSLLSYNAHIQRYRYHQLIKEFFVYVSSEFTQNKNELLNDTFFVRFEAYYVTLSNNFQAYEASDFYYLLDTERSNIDFVATYGYEDKFTHDLSKNITELRFGIYKMILTVLHTCKWAHSVYSRSPLLGVLLKPIARYAHVIEELNIRTQEVQDTFQGFEGFDYFALFLQGMYTDLADLYSSILSGNIPYAVSMGIEIGQRGLINFDFHFMAVLKHKGLSVSLQMYVNLIVRLSKLEARVHGQQKAVEVLLLRYERITELYSTYASVLANDPENRQVYIRYHLAVRHNYILLGQFDKFLECWKKILRLKWTLEKCKYVDCTPTHLALAHFGQGDYEQSTKHLEALLQSKSVKGNRRVQLFILLYESYRNLGDTERAAHLLTKVHHISRFPSIRNITARDYVNSTNLSIRYDRHHGDHFETWLLDKECMIVSTKNYRTCLMLAGFYKTLRSEDASKLGNILNHVLGHFIRHRHHWYEISWYKYDIYCRVSECNGRNILDTLTIALALLGIIFVAVLGCIVLLHL